MLYMLQDMNATLYQGKIINLHYYILAPDYFFAPRVSLHPPARPPVYRHLPPSCHLYCLLYCLCHISRYGSTAAEVYCLE